MQTLEEQSILSFWNHCENNIFECIKNISSWLSERYFQNVLKTFYCYYWITLLNVVLSKFWKR